MKTMCPAIASQDPPSQDLAALFCLGCLVDGKRPSMTTSSHRAKHTFTLIGLSTALFIIGMGIAYAASAIVVAVGASQTACAEAAKSPRLPGASPCHKSCSNERRSAQAISACGSCLRRRGNRALAGRSRRAGMVRSAGPRPRRRREA
jgi:hypothetical protein